MGIASGTVRAAGAAVVALLVTTGVAIAAGESRPRGAGTRERGEIAGSEGARILVTPVYQATGVRDAATAATVVHCTNLGATLRTVWVDIYGFDGVFECGLSADVASGETRTFATRDVLLYTEDAVCATAPLTEQGSLDILLATTTNLICTVQVVDPASTTPRYVTTLDLFRP